MKTVKAEWSVWLSRYWPVPLAVAFACVAIFLPPPHPFTDTGAVERILFSAAAVGLAAMPWGWRDSVRFRAYVATVVGAACWSRALASFTEAPESRGVEIVRAVVFVAVAWAVFVLIVVTRTKSRPQ